MKEVKLFGLGPLVLGRYRALFRKFFDEDRRLAAPPPARRARPSGFVSILAFYGMYALMAGRAARGDISLGDLTLYIAVFRQGQGAVQAILSAVGGMYEDALFMSNLFGYLHIPTGGEAPRAPPPLARPAGRPGADRAPQRLLPLPGEAPAGRCATSRSRSRRARSSGSSARTARGRARS